MDFNDYNGLNENNVNANGNENDLWKSFAAVGRVEDYLRYKGIDIYANNSDVAVYSQTKPSKKSRKNKNRGAAVDLKNIGLEFSSTQNSIVKDKKERESNGNQRSRDKRK